jgi:hypothetical protein
MSDDALERLFPALTEGGFDITSPPDRRYNCIAWAAGDVTRWWWPAESPFAYWPAGMDREESLTSFIRAFATLGYEPASSGDPEPSFEKVAIFASSDGVPTHMARQLGDGSWTSKLGGLEDIAHRHVTGLAGAEYGNVVAFLKRRESELAERAR